MASLTTVYSVTIVLGSLLAIGSAFLGNYVYPIQSGGAQVPEAPPVVATEVPQNIEQTSPEVVSTTN